MKPEPKSILSSENDIGSHSIRGRITPADFPSASQHPQSSTLLVERIDGEAISESADLRGGTGIDTLSVKKDVQEETNRRTPIFPNVFDGKSPSFNIERPLLRTSSLPSSQTPAPTSPATSTSKHGRSEDSNRQISREHPPKRNRSRLRPKHKLDPEAFKPSFAQPRVTSPTSPLFFSHSPRRRPALQPSFSSTEAIATMLNKARDESLGIKTLKLARGSVNVTSPPRSISTPISGGSFDRASVQRSPDPRTRLSSGTDVLANVGIIELLEQDERPTFIIDVANQANFIPGGHLQIIFINVSLRAYESIVEMITGHADLESPSVAVTNDFPAFKQWALSYVKDGQSENIALPSFIYAGITWTCKTLRRHIRIISGSGSGLNAGPVSSVGSSLASGSSVLSGRIPLNKVQETRGKTPLVESSEPLDYFGDVTSPLISRGVDPDELLVGPLREEQEKGVPSNQAILATQDEAITSEMMLARCSDQASPSFDWTRIPFSIALPKHIQFARSVDWSKTPLGPIENWGYDLRAMANLIMGSPHPAAMYWGKEYTAIYNEAYILVAGKQHPWLMGQSYKEAWAELWDELGPVFSSAMDFGQSTMKDDDCLFLKRNGYLEECYFSWSIIPLVGEDGSVVGLYNPAFEKTRRKIAERRMLTLREVGEKTAAAREVKGFWGQVIRGLEYNQYDVPFVLLYSVSDDSDSDMSSMHSGSLAQAPQCILEGTLGVPPSHKAAASPLDLKTSEDGFAPYLREAMKTNKPVLLTAEDGTLSYDVIDGFEWRGFGDPCRAAVICPIHPTTGDNILGFLVMGINPRRPYDDDYSLFIQLLSRQLATSMASVVLFEEEIRRGQRAARLAALDRQELSKQLDLRTQEAVESETKFTRMAEFAPVGMFIADSQGTVTYSNDTWWEISRHPRSENSVSSWMDSIKEEDRERVEQIWKKLVNNKTAITEEFRFKSPWQDANGNFRETWALLSAYPERDSDGELKSVFGCITNISQQKWAEGFQKQRMEEAIELKRQQENFIDMTSHEMRNPLSAILQCSDEITTSLTKCTASEDATKISKKLIEALESSIDAAQTIALCAQHQKRIVDDILTLSKLDSALLIVTPVSIQPIAVVQHALKMFEGELDTNDIAMEFRMEKSYSDLAIDWVRLDPSRLLQVLINLTTNAIKFTHGQEKRTIVVSVGASKERPNEKDSNVSFFPSRSKRKDLTTNQDEWGSGEELYLHFSVQDTGRGLDVKEKTLLFQRFSQASPRTHVQYGGSGLGLFISRELTELQGGEIGVSSERGVGSTFAFYVKARRVDDITEDAPITTTISSLRRNSSNSAVTLESRWGASSKATQRSITSKKRSYPSLFPPDPTPPVQVYNIDHSKLTILIVEDNLVNQRVLQRQLRNLGFQTGLANHGGEAIDFLKTTDFWKGNQNKGRELAVILMDLEMPVMDGLTCARTIREMEQDGTILRHVPIIAVTANARQEQIETAMSAGMDDVVSKPFRIPDLVPKVEELVTKFKVTTAAASSSTQETST